MSDARTKADWPVIAAAIAAATLAIVFSLYVGGYFWLGRREVELYYARIHGGVI